MTTRLTALLAGLALGAGLALAGCEGDNRKDERNPFGPGGVDKESFSEDGDEGWGMEDGYTGSGGAFDGDRDRGRRPADQDRQQRGGRGDRTEPPGDMDDDDDVGSRKGDNHEDHDGDSEDGRLDREERERLSAPRRDEVDELDD